MVKQATVRPCRVSLASIREQWFDLFSLFFFLHRLYLHIDLPLSSRLFRPIPPLLLHFVFSLPPILLSFLQNYPFLFSLRIPHIFFILYTLYYCEVSSFPSLCKHYTSRTDKAYWTYLFHFFSIARQAVFIALDPSPRAANNTAHPSQLKRYIWLVLVGGGLVSTEVLNQAIPDGSVLIYIYIYRERERERDKYYL